MTTESTPGALGSNAGLGGCHPERASACGLTECAGKPMCARCLQWADMGQLSAALPPGVRWQTPLTPALVRELLAFETRRWEEALRLTWQMVDQLNPAGSPGSYARARTAGLSRR